MAAELQPYKYAGNTNLLLLWLQSSSPTSTQATLTCCCCDCRAPALQVRRLPDADQDHQDGDQRRPAVLQVCATAVSCSGVDLPHRQLFSSQCWGAAAWEWHPGEGDVAVHKGKEGLPAGWLFEGYVQWGLLMFRMYVSLDFLAISLGVSPLLVSCVFGCLFTISLSSVGQLCLSLPQSLSSVGQLCLWVSFPSTVSLSSVGQLCLSLPQSLSSVGQLCLWVSFPSTISLSSVGQLCLWVSFPSAISLSSVGQLCLWVSFPSTISLLCWSAVSLGVFPFHHLSPLLVSCVFGCLSLPPSLSSVGQLCLWVSFPSTISLLCWSAVSLGVFPFHHLSPLLVSCVFGCLSLPPSLSSVGQLCLWVSFPSTISLLSALPPSLSHSPHLLPPPPCTSFLICWLCCGSADKETRMYLWWSLCPLYLHACQVRVT